MMAFLGVAAVLFISVIHGNLGSGHGLQAYAYLAAPGATGSLTLPQLGLGLATHPGAVVAKLWSKRLDLWANLASSGGLGLAFLPLLPLMLVVILANDLFRGFLFSEPLFQSLPIYVLLPVGTVAVLGWLARRRRWLACCSPAWSSRRPSAGPWSGRRARRTSGSGSPASTAATLAAVEARIPPSAAVFASQGVVGRFSSRLDVRPLERPPADPAGRGLVHLHPLGGHRDPEARRAPWCSRGSWPGPCTPPWSPIPMASGCSAGTRPAGCTGSGCRAAPSRSAWTAPGAAGRAVLTGPASGWHVTSTGRPGYVADRLEWNRWPGRYEAAVRLSARGPVNVEVWDNTGGVLLARRSLPGTDGIQSVTLPVDATTGYPAPLYAGWGPFRAKFGGGPKAQRIEVRVWTPGGAPVNVYGARLTPAR